MMSQKEFQRVKVIENAVAGRLRVGEAARLLRFGHQVIGVGETTDSFSMRVTGDRRWVFMAVSFTGTVTPERVMKVGVGTMDASTTTVR